MEFGADFSYFCEIPGAMTDLCIALPLGRAAGFAPYGWAGFRALLPSLPRDEDALDRLPDFDVTVVLRRWVEELRAGTGSATCKRRPGSTRTPEGMPFQRRNWLRETPKRSAMVTRVSPRRTV